MVLNDLERDEFLQKLHTVLRPSVPIDSMEFLFGRRKEFDNIEEALYAQGRHCFIYGERGVGKSSLAFSIANHLQSSDKPHLRINCVRTSTFISVIQQIINLLAVDEPKKEITNSVNAGLKVKGFGIEGQHTERYTVGLDDELDPQTAANLLREKAHRYSKKTVIVVDEFDTIQDIKDKELFGELIKALSNLGCDFKFIFTGIATSLNDLLGGHGSSVRQIHQEHVEPLDWTGRYEIIDKAFGFFNQAISDDIRFRIAGMSDGYPSYVHLMCEKLLNEIYRSKQGELDISFSLFIAALDSAIDSIAQDIKKDYVSATKGRDEHFHHLLWAMADSADQIRKLEHIKFSYACICEHLSIEPLEDKIMKREFAKFKNDSFGNIIEKGIQNRTGWFKFKESMVRGLVRMYAEKHGIQLDFERHFTAGKIHVTSKYAYSRYQPLTPVENEVAHLRKEKDESV